MSDEVWMPIPGYEGRYEASSYGQIRSLWLNNKQCSRLRDVPLILKQNDGGNGYRHVTLGKDNKSSTKHVHKLVLLAFRGPRPEGWVACHLSGDSSDNHVENLQWGSCEENESHKVGHGTVMRGERNWNAKLSATDVIQIRAMAGQLSQRKLAKMFGVSNGLISSIQTGDGWAHVTKALTPAAEKEEG